MRGRQGKVIAVRAGQLRRKGKGTNQRMKQRRLIDLVTGLIAPALFH